MNEDQASAEALDGSDDARYRLLVESLFDYAIYMLDSEGRVASWNPGARRIKGYEAEEALGRHFSLFYPEEARADDAPRKALETAAREGRFEAEGWRVRKDGARFWAHVVIDPIRDPAGQLIGYAKVTRDFTARRAAEEALRLSEERFRLLMESVTDCAITMLDPAGRVASWNAGGRRLKGYEPEEIVGEHVSKFYTEEDKAAGLPQLGLDTAAREGRFEKEGVRIRKDGSRFWAHVVIEPVRDASGALVGFAKVVRDVTERKQAEQRLEEAREALFQSQKLEAVGRLTGGVAHDFNNLLTVVLGSLEMLERKLPDDPALKRLLTRAIEGAKRGASLTQRMLVFARQGELDPKPVDVASLVRDMTDLMKRSLGEAIKLRIHLPSALPRVVVDADQFELALLHLLANAREAMPNGGTVRIEAHEERIGALPGALPAGGYIRLSVADDGVGMDAETLRRAKEPFFTTKAIGKGAGLGLSMAHRLAEHSNGALTLTSEVGKGATAELWLPVAPAAQDEAEAQDEDAPAGGLSILAVDDDPLVLMNTVAMLEEMGHRVLPATRGVEALEILRRLRAVDLLLTDVMMPEMTGLELARRASEARPNLPILLVTGYADLPSGGQKLLRLAKPFSLAELAQAVEEAMGGRAGVRQRLG
jgi:PAS domain S-box-containing protein